MTTNRDFDRLARAWLDLMPDEAPDRLIANVRLAVDLTPQERRWGWRAIRRSFQTRRRSWTMAMVAVALALVGVAFVVSSGTPNPTKAPPTPMATPSTAPTAHVQALAPESLRATWVADLGSPAASGDGSTPLARLLIRTAEISVTTTGSGSFFGRPVAGAFDELTFEATAGSCRPGDLGRYRYAFGTDGTVPNSDGTLLALTVVADSCATRQAVLDRTWVRAIDAENRGGRGVASNFSPMVLVTLPLHSYKATLADTDVLMVESSEGSGVAFVAARNPWGWAEPCSDSGGAKVPLSPTIDAFATYLAGLPGFTVQRSDVEIDSLPAVHLTVPTTKTPECQDGGPNNGHVQEWTTSNPDYQRGSFISQGDTDSIYLVEVDGDLFLLQWLAIGAAEQDELQILSTVRFATSLPR